MKDRNEEDEKIIAIPYGDPQYNSYKDIEELPKHIFEELRHFLTIYKQLENKKVVVEDLENHEKAKQIIKDSIERYKKLKNKG